MEENDYSEDVSILLEGVQTGRLRVEKLKKTTMSGNKDKYIITISDTAIPTKRKKTTKKTANDNVNSKISEKPEIIKVDVVKPKTDITKPEPPAPPVMCKIQKLT